MIRRLPQNVVDKIAAGEVVVRPAAALKELIENSIDAKSTKIEVCVADGGMSFLQISDNGTGIRKEDLPVACHRFTTSKITTYEEMKQISTFGFRGEALSSMSQVSRLSISSRTPDSDVAFQCAYEEGDPVGQIFAAARGYGTTITIKEMFYNMPRRAKALESSYEEYSRVLDVISSYAVQFPKISFSCKKKKSTVCDVKTSEIGDTKDVERAELHRERISQIFGQKTSEELIFFEISKSPLKVLSHLQSCYGFVSNPNFSHKKFFILLFVNNRLVEAPSLKRGIESSYQDLLPRGSFPWVYLSLWVDTESLDVNVHPTKRSVHFLEEELLSQFISDEVRRVLEESSESRVFQPSDKKIRSNRIINTSTHVDSGPTRVRTDYTQRSVQSFFRNVPSQEINENDKCIESVENSLRIEESDILQERRKPVYDSDCKELISVAEIKSALKEGLDVELTQKLRKCVWVGSVTERKCLLQYFSELWIVDLKEAMRDLLLFSIMDRIGELPVYDLSRPIFLPEYLGNDNSKILATQADMLWDYFSIKITHEKHLISIPRILARHFPGFEFLGDCLTQIADCLVLENEKQVFLGIAKTLAVFYSSVSLKEETSPNRPTSESVESTLRHTFFASIQKCENYFLHAEYGKNKNNITVLASLDKLYRVFERC
eukprot:GHVP01058795.1.p1 GENE.GHVP01058795.1~~GHVP01058795.1.p1  ORF type:complete len:662 (-),score=113.01 GHVP01058795.1:413-2398(-)